MSAGAEPGRTSLWVSALLTALVAFGAISTDLYLPSMPALGKDLSAEPALVQLTFSAFMIGFALAQLVYGPLSDRFGRRPVLLLGLTIYVVAAGLCALAQTIEQLIFARFLLALGACSGPVLARAVVRDLYGRERAARMLAYMGAVMGVIPAVAPTIGGFLTAYIGWRSNFLFLAAFAAACLLGTWFLLQESNRFRDPAATQPVRLLRNYRYLLGQPDFLGYSLAIGFIFGGFAAYIPSSSYLLIDYVGISVANYGYYFAIGVGGYVLGTLIAGRFGARIGLDRMILLGSLIGLLGAALFLGGALVGWKHWVPIIGPATVMLVGVGLIVPNAVAGAIGPYPTMAGAASALMGFVQMSFGAISSIVVGSLFDGTPLYSGWGLIVCTAAGALSFYVLVWRRLGNARSLPAEAQA